MAYPQEIDAVEGISEVQRRSKVVITHDPSVLGISPDYNFRPAMPIAFNSSIQTARAPTDAELDLREAFLAKPKKKNTAIGLEVARALERQHETISDIVSILVKNMKYENEIIVTLSKEEQEKLQNHLDELAKRNKVEVYEEILNSIAAASAIVVGSMVISPQAIAALLLTTSAATAATAAAAAIAPVWGYLLVASGIINLINNQVMPRVGGWEKLASFFTSDKAGKEALKSKLQTGTNIVNSIMAVASSIATGNLIPTIFGSSLVTRVIDTGTKIATGTTHLVKGYTDSRVRYASADVDKSHGQTYGHEEKYKQEKTSKNRN